jgi:hypothetical protein
MNLRYFFNTFTRIFLVKKSIENQNVNNATNIVYGKNYMKLLDNKLLINTMINLVN